MTYIPLAAGTRPTALVFAASPPSYHLAEHSLRFYKTVRSSLENMLDNSACWLMERDEFERNSWRIQMRYKPVAEITQSHRTYLYTISTRPCLAYPRIFQLPERH